MWKFSLSTEWWTSSPFFVSLILILVELEKVFHTTRRPISIFFLNGGPIINYRATGTIRFIYVSKNLTWEIFNCHHSKCRNGEAFTRNILYSFPKATNVGQTHIWNLPSHWWKTGLVNKNFGLPSPRCIHLRTEVSFPLLAALLRMHEHTHITQAPAKQSNGVDIQHTPLPTPYSNRPLRNPHFHTFFASPQRFLWPCFHYRNQ